MKGGERLGYRCSWTEADACLGPTSAVMKSGDVSASPPLSHCHSALAAGFLPFYLRRRADSLLSKPHL